jgi:hypothetical protein
VPALELLAQGPSIRRIHVLGTELPGWGPFMSIQQAADVSGGPHACPCFLPDVEPYRD